MHKNSIEIRKLILSMVYKSGSSHIGSCYSIVDVVDFLYREKLQITPNTIRSPERDRLIMSKGHAAAAIYATLAYYKFFDPQELDNYAENDSIYMSHVSDKVPGVEFATGSLGHGLPFGVGKALALNQRQSKAKTFVILSDGELNEGSNWEAIMFAAHHRLSNLNIIIDSNKLQSLDTTKQTLDLGDVGQKLRIFDWNVIEFDGNQPLEIQLAFAANQENCKPTAYIAHTIKGYGVPFMENKVSWHYKSPNDAEYKLAMEYLNAH